VSSSEQRRPLSSHAGRIVSDRPHAVATLPPPCVCERTPHTDDPRKSGQKRRVCRPLCRCRRIRCGVSRATYTGSRSC
jgi:hypothetical protein